MKLLDMSQAQFFEKFLPTLFIAIDKKKYFELVEKVYGIEELNRLTKIMY
ncbi:hypothetical protein SAMN05446037_100183 [Anaerovirgula multivorans]|uniref:Uncharacterized protein n=1 Tax=Anaerovirgula multivorans TaxID=312168 RepID=A0A238ZTQ1_9FIRM|nr:hypothetical protein [Anaerovirgula multivorans]SNR86298.1 hypothetical protein SAMN05446037_100183 [Anaerovirgula multivorans]